MSVTVSFSQVENKATFNYLFYAPENVGNGNNIQQSNVDFNYFLQSKKIFKKVKWDNNFSYRSLFLEGGINKNLQDLSYSTNFLYTKNLKNFLIFNARVNVRSELQNDVLFFVFYKLVKLCKFPSFRNVFDFPVVTNFR